MSITMEDPQNLIQHITGVLSEMGWREGLFPKAVSRSTAASAVLVPLAQHVQDGLSPEPCLVFNKRSSKVKQAGDLCFPGGRISPRLDGYLSKLLNLPHSPLTRWPYWPRWRGQRPEDARRLARLLVTSLRESFEEMRLNPLGVRFLGPLPSQPLVMFERVIYPMVGWINHQRRFFPNWEVEKLIHIPLNRLLAPDSYARYRLQFQFHPEGNPMGTPQDFPCFLHRDGDEAEVLWGATYRITMVLLKVVFAFEPPDMASRPVVHGSVDEGYFGE